MPRSGSAHTTRSRDALHALLLASLCGGCSAQTGAAVARLDEPAACEPPLVFGYRGSRGRAPENTLAAFRYAIAAGADGFEADVRKTADGVLIAMHDSTTGRTTDDTADRAVSELRYDEVAELDAGSWFSDEFTGEPVPRIEDVVALLPPDFGIVFDLKQAGVERDVAELIEREGLAERAFVSSFHPERTRYVRERLPSVRAGLCLRTMDELPLAADAAAEFVRIPLDDERDEENWDSALARGLLPVVSGPLIDYHVGMVMAESIEIVLQLRDERTPAHCR